MTTTGQSPAPTRYSAPALEKGLDILELLASRGSAMSQTAIATALERSPSELFRMINCLERRGYLQRDPAEDRYRLSAKLYALSHQHPPTQRLLECALPIMRALASQTEQSCHLTVQHEDQAMVLAHVQSPQPVSITVRTGTMTSLPESASGRILLAFMPEDRRDALLATGQPPKLLERLAEIQKRGYEQRRSAQSRGILDLSVPIRDPNSQAIAALTVPFLTLFGSTLTAAACRDHLIEAAAELTAQVAGDTSSS